MASGPKSVYNRAEEALEFSSGVSDVSKHLVLAKDEEGGGQEQTFTCLFLLLSDWQLFADVFLTCPHMPCTLGNSCRD